MRWLAITWLVVAFVVGACGAPAPAASAEEDADSGGAGREIYQAQRCWMCHSIAGKGNKKNPLDGVGSKLTREEIGKWIVSPREMNPDSKMKAYKDLSAEDLDTLVDYLAGLKKKGS